MQTQQPNTPIGIVVAVREELAAVCLRLKPISMAEREGVTFFFGEMAGRTVVVGRSGMGVERAARLTELLIKHFSPSAMVIAGFCAALSTSHKPGDIIQTTDANAILTLDHIVTTAQEKRAIVAANPTALALDMETAGAIRVSEAAGLPWTAVRAVTDGLDDDLPLDFSQFTRADGETDRLRVALYAITHPWRIPALTQLGSRAATAATHLADGIETLIRA